MSRYTRLRRSSVIEAGQSVVVSDRIKLDALLGWKCLPGSQGPLENQRLTTSLLEVRRLQQVYECIVLLSVEGLLQDTNIVAFGREQEPALINGEAF